MLIMTLCRSHHTHNVDQPADLKDHDQNSCKLFTYKVKSIFSLDNPKLKTKIDNKQHINFDTK